VAIILTFIIAPRATPIVAAVLSIGFLTLGVREHYKMFAPEYRLSTWQEGIKIYAPAIMIGAILLFILYSILAFFTKGGVPVPQIPNISEPSNNTVTNSIIEKVNNVVNSITNTKNNIISSFNNTINKVNNNRTSILNTLTGSNENKGNNKNKNNVSRSFLETL
jgi:hypothetical protein